MSSAGDRNIPGDDVIASPSMLYNQMITVDADAETVFPWLLQLGKSRGGWYGPAWLERFLPRGWRATRQVQTQWQHLNVGDRVPDYGFSDDFFIVESIEAPNFLVYRSERYGCQFTWALLLRENATGDNANDVQTIVHLRFRGRIQSEGWKRAVIVWAGEKMDRLTTRPMLLGLKERVERPHAE